MKCDARPIDVDVRMFKIVRIEKDILNICYDFKDVLANGLRYTEQRPFLKFFKLELFENLWPVYPLTAL
jgi:hypothetical protein